MLTIKPTKLAFLPDFVGLNLSNAYILLTLDSKFYSMNNDKKISYYGAQRMSCIG